MRRWLAGLGILAAVAVGIGATAQTFPAPITQAITLLTTGVTPFTLLGLSASSYINWGTSRSASGYGFRDNSGVIESKNSGGSWAPLSTTGSAPSSATFITQTPNASLSAEQPLSALATAIMVNTTATGVVTTYGGTSCTNQFLSALSVLGVGTCASVSPSMITGTWPVANGGTGATTLTGLLIGNGTSAFTAATSSTVGQVLRVTGANTYAWGTLNLASTNAVGGTLPLTQGGLGLTSGTSGGVLYFSGAAAISSSALLTASQIVLGGGAGTAPATLGSLGTTTTVLHGNAAGAPTFAAVDIAADTTGNVPATRGGTGITSYAVGDLPYADTTTTLAKLADVAVNAFLRSGGVNTAPVWSTTLWTNSATAGDLLQATGANTYGNLAAVAVGSYLRSAGVATPSIWSTLTLPNAATTGDLLMANAADTVSTLADVATGRVLVSGGVGVVPSWSTAPSATTFTASTAFVGSGTTSATGVVRLANTSIITERNAGNSADINLLSASASDQIVIGNANAIGFAFAGTSGSIKFTSSAPTISSGFGAAPAAPTGVASLFKITVGGGGDTAGVVLFNATWAAAPLCFAQNQTTTQPIRTTPTTTQVTLTGTFAASDVLQVFCASN